VEHSSVWELDASAGTADDARDEGSRGRSQAVALSDLYERYHLEVFRYLRGIGAGVEDAADLAAATFERALGALSRYEPREAGSRAWLFRIARNLAIDAARRRDAADRGLRFWPRTTVAADPVDLLIQNEADRDLARRVAALPAAQREAVILRFAAGLTAREIGQVLGRSEAAAHKLMNRALLALKEAYRDDA
jgi:RNA polymerase sigma-70 factor, ECF subfamily